MRIISIVSLLIFFKASLFAQQPIDSIHNLDEVIIEGQRLSLPFSNTSHAISVISEKDIEQLPISSLEEALQYVAGVDIRRRGVAGMQSDLYIRGGNFNQTLLLIDGIKLDDSQTGHHTMNAIINLDNIKCIEVIKGAAARIYGQNAMNGAVNIITKKIRKNKAKISLSAGSFENFGASVSYQKVLRDASIKLMINKRQSEGYRYNTDFDNWNFYLKADYKKYELIASLAKRDFGANGFYASPAYKDQYEETMTNMLALHRDFVFTNWKVKPSLYWRRNEDMYLFLRHDPDFYRNLHTNNKMGLSIDASNKNNLGVTGLGVDANYGFLTSNNLGDRRRFATILFIEHRFELANNKLDITPGVSTSFYSDFNFFTNPGFTIGYKFSDSFKVYGNIGYTYRIPTYTNLYYNSKIEQGNPDLKPELALTSEVGLRTKFDSFRLNISVFNRESTNLIDWIRSSEKEKWTATNITEVTTKGFETEVKYKYEIAGIEQNIVLGYTFLDDRIHDSDIAFSRYSLNSYKHHITGNLQTQFIDFFKQYLSYRFVERSQGEKYHLVDVGVSTQFKSWYFKFNANNVLNTDYTETNLLPMPKFNYMLELSYTF